ncbi:hypothetical protein TWF694_011686 [Orbilia ellipsospora]|uniref:Uncharacterized protein n=1 Tax=Orbilia ellipsospora TaxID=2528407 RepID=A0AAV9X7C3_9PEZI
MASNQSSPSPPRATRTNSLTSLAASIAAELPTRKPPTQYTQRPSRLTKNHPKLTVKTRNIPVSSVSELPKSRILPTIRNISIFSTLGAACIIACIALVLLKRVSFWVTLAASFCGVIGAALFIEVALLVSARFNCRILDEECTIADMVHAEESRHRKGLSWDLRGIGRKRDDEEKGNVIVENRRNSTTNQSLKSGPPSALSISDSAEKEPVEDEIDEKDVTIGVAIQRPAPIATTLPVNRV